MAIYQITDEGIAPIAPTTFADARVRERNDLQRLLRDRIDIIAPDTMVIAEEFGHWEDSRRRIDLLAIDKNANLVVIELKRTEDGGHMDLQAVRYAAMLSTMTFAKAVAAFESYLESRSDDRDAEQLILEFLDWDEPNEEEFATDVRIVLASAEFSRELTTAVLWLADHGIDIRCVRIRPYGESGALLLDVQQVIPLPEAADFQVQVREKQQQERVARQSARDYGRFNVTVDGVVTEDLNKRRAIHAIVKALCDAGVSVSHIRETIHWRKNLFVAAPGHKDESEMIAALQAENGSQFEARRWFTKAEELIHQGETTYAFTNQWGRRAESAMRKLIEELGDGRITYERTR